MKARELLKSLGYEDIGCCDNSCMFGSPGGMGTNGGCRCLPRASKNNITDDEIHSTRRLVMRLAQALGKIAGTTERP